MTLNARSELFDELHPVTPDHLPPRPHTVMSGYLPASSVRIVNHSSTKTNPTPLSPQNEPNSSELQSQFLSPNKLREVSGAEDFSQISYIELSVNTTTTSVGNFGAYLPNLSQLCLLDSVVYSIRDLGTSLASLRTLWLANCSLKDLDGLAALPSLQELYVSHNNISDVSLMSLLSGLEVLDLESNLLDDLDQLGYLCLCLNLSVLNLANNPIAKQLTQLNAVGYRETVKQTIPHLKVLDELPFDGEDISGLKSSSSYLLASTSMLDKWRDVNKGLLSPNSIHEQELLHKKIIQRPQSSSSRGNISTSSLIGPLSSVRNDSVTVAGDSSELTHGLNQVICGNPVKALRQRQKKTLSCQSSINITATPTTKPFSSSSGSQNNDEGSSQRRSIEDIIPMPFIPLPPRPATTPSGTRLRPHTASDFRSRRFRKSPKTSNQEQEEHFSLDANVQSNKETRNSHETEQQPRLIARTNPIRSRKIVIK